MLLGPADVHARQHSGPVLALGAAGAGVDFEKGIIGVGLAGKQRLDLLAGDLVLEHTQRSFGFGDDRLIAFGLAELDEAGVVADRSLEAEHLVDAAFELLARAHEALRLLRIVPERGVFGPGVQLGESLLRGIEVKDASSAVPATA